MDDEVLNEIREASQAGTLLSGERFRKEIEMAQKIRLTRAPRGRPRKRREDPLADDQLKLAV